MMTVTVTTIWRSALRDEREAYQCFECGKRLPVESRGVCDAPEPHESRIAGRIEPGGKSDA